MVSSHAPAGPAKLKLETLVHVKLNILLGPFQDTFELFIIVIKSSLHA